MGLAWKVLLPLAILDIVLTAFFRLLEMGGCSDVDIHDLSHRRRLLMSGN